MTLTALTAEIDAVLPQTAPTYTTIRTAAIKMAVNYASPEYRETTYQEFTAKDGITTRYALTGRDVRVIDAPEAPTATGVNTAGVAAPTAAPTLTALPSGGSLVAGLYYWGYCGVTARGDTQMSALSTVTVVANGRITRAAVTLATGWTGIKDFYSSEPFDADVRVNGAAVAGTALTVTAATSAAGAKPFRDNHALTAYSPVVMLEPGVDVDGTANTAVTTMTLATAPAAGDTFRVWYTRKPLVPSAGSDVINLPDEWLKNAALFYACTLLSLNHESGDATRYAAVAAALDPIVMDLKQRGAGRVSPTVLASSWSATNG